MDPCSQNRSLVPTGEIDITNNVSTGLPLEIWDIIFSYLGFQDLKLFTEHKVKVLKKPLDGNEDQNRLMMGEKLIFNKKDFLNVVATVYNIALCCKDFYVLTQRERNLLINAAQYARFNRQFLFEEGPIEENKEDERIRSKIKEIQKINRMLESIASSHRHSIPNIHSHLISRVTLDTFNTNVVNERLMNQPFRQLVDSLRFEPLKLESLEPLKQEHEFKALILDNNFEKIEVRVQMDENQQEQPSDTNDKWKCVIQ